MLINFNFNIINKYYSLVLNIILGFPDNLLLCFHPSLLFIVTHLNQTLCLEDES